MSLFTDHAAGCMAAASDIIGGEEFTVSGYTGTFQGILNEFASEKEIEIGGIIGTYSATLVCELEQFDDCAGPLERRFDGRLVTVGGRTFKITRAALDDISLTFGLAHPAAK